MLTTENLILFLAAFYLAAIVYSLISHQKPSNVMSIADLTTSINNRGGGWIILTPVVALVALLYNFVVTSFWFLGVVVHFIAWLLKWVWNEVIVAGGYFIFSILWHYLVKWPWKLILLAFGKVLSSLKLNYLFVGAMAISVSLAIMFFGRFFQMLFESGDWITYLFGVLAIVPIGVGVSWIVQLLKGRSKEEAKAGTRKYLTHLSYILLALIALVLVQGGLVYLGTLTSLSSIFSTLLAGGNLLGSFLVIVNSVVIIFSLAALPSFSDQYQGENRDVIKSFFNYLINHNWGKYVIAAPAMLIPLIIACAIPYIVTQGISYLAGQVSDQVFETRLAQLRKTQNTLPSYNYEDWLDVQATSDDSLKVWKRNDMERATASLGILNTESTQLYMQTFYKAHSSEYAAAPVGALFYLFDRFYKIENSAVSTTPLSPVVVSIDTSAMNNLNTQTIPQIQENIASIDKRLTDLRRELSAVCNTGGNDTQTPPSPTPATQEPQTSPEQEQPNLDQCAIQRAYINEQISDATKAKVNADKSLIRAKEVASHLEEVYNLEKSSNSNSSGSSKLAYLLISLWLCLLIGLAFCPIIPLFAQVNHSVFTTADDSELFILSRIRSASAANPNQPLLGTILFVVLLSAQTAVSIPGLNSIRGLIPALPNLESVFSTSMFNASADDESTEDEPTGKKTEVEIKEVEQEEPEEVEEVVLAMEDVEVKPEYTGSSFSYNSNLHTENGAPGASYEVTVTYIVEVDGSVSDIMTTTENGYGLEDEIVNAVKMTSGEWTPARQGGVPVRCKVTNTFQFPSEN